MKYILVLTILFSSASFAANKQFLKCLGQEELFYHTKKVAGPYKKLNEKMISELVQISRTLTIKTKYQDEICTNKNYPPSMVLLKLLITKKQKIFLSLTSRLDVKQRSMDKRTMTEIVHNAGQTFVNFVNNLQVISGKPNCIVKNIPDLKLFFVKSRYTLEDEGILKLISEINDIDNLFKKLNQKGILKKC